MWTTRLKCLNGTSRNAASTSLFIQNEGKQLALGNKKEAFIKRVKASPFVPTFSGEFKVSYKHLNLTKHGFMSFIAASGKQRAQPGGRHGDQTV